jgi:hypothetical protein
MAELSFTPPTLAGAIDFGPARARMSKLLHRLLQRIGLTGMRYFVQAMLTDTGFSRARASYAVDLDGQGVKWGILSPAKSEDGADLATLLNWMEHGIRRHWVSFTNRDGSTRYMLVKWFERHGFKVWKSPTTGRAVRRHATGYTTGSSMLAMRGHMVWGYSHPALSTSMYFVRADFPELLGSIENTL